jgi:splicing suppressor protein 51
LLINDPFRVFILGSTEESQLPAAIWEQLNLSFPGVPFRLYFIGPDSNPPRVEMTNRYSHLQPGTKRISTIYSTVSRHQRPITSQHPNGETAVVNSIVNPVSVNLRMEYIRARFEEVADNFGPFRKNRDVFVLFNPGIGRPEQRDQWRPALDSILKSRCLTIITSLNQSKHFLRKMEMNFQLN